MCMHRGEVCTSRGEVYVSRGKENNRVMKSLPKARPDPSCS